MSPAVLAALPGLAAETGWSWTTLRRALAAAGEDPALVASVFPAGPTGAIAAWFAGLDAAMPEAAGPLDGLRTPARVRRLVEARLHLLAPHKPALRAAWAHLALPWNLPLGARLGAQAADAIWKAAGDASADFSWYTRRASLGAIYAATIAFWLREEATVEQALGFLDRRFAGLARLQRRRTGR